MGRAIAGVGLVGVLWLSGCGPSAGTMDALSAAGKTEQNAPVRAEVEIHIAAPPAKVWGLLIDAPAWPTWCPQIQRVETPGELEIGKRFTWKSGGSTIHSEVHLFVPQHRLSWTGTAFPARAVHVWNLEAAADGGTTVGVAESMDGPLLGKLYPSNKLVASDRSWLAALKAAAEK